MAILPIRVFPDPVLRVRCPEVTRFDDGLRKLAEDMVETMHAAPGVGLAAPQVGVALRLAVVDLSAGEDPSKVHVFVNPEIVKARGQKVEVEGCLSLPGFSEKIQRPGWIRLQALDLTGRPFEMEAEGWLARAICHEVDHLDGRLIVDRLAGLRRERARRYLRRMERAVEVTV